MKVVVARERSPGENRVALIPEGAQKLKTLGADVYVESGAGANAGHPDSAYTKAGATVVADANALYANADVVLRVQAPLRAELDHLPANSLLVGFLAPLTSPDLLAQLAQRRVTALAVELVPRITRAQVMDALSSQATVVGYKSVLNAAAASGRFFPMLMTAAGTIPPAKVLVIGAGVAGLMAIATARRLGAVVQAFDIRAAAKEQVESLGATFVGFHVEEGEGKGGYAQEVSEETKRKEHEHLRKLIAESDVVITTAQVPGRRAPVLVTRDMIEAMKPGSVIVDCAAENGGNCELTEPGKEVLHQGVHIQGPLNLPSTLPTHASFMYSRNVVALVTPMFKDGQLFIDLQDDVVGPACVTHEGEVRVGKPAAVAAATN
ncbi:MAG TPA: Re/Si-specific NAD(P)(+) transhydrogenase subunit alpha [Longimicrobiales bacterium]